MYVPDFVSSRSTEVKNSEKTVSKSANPFSNTASNNPFQTQGESNPFSPVQMKENPLQKMEEEEELQMKKSPLQKMEMEEEELQMKEDASSDAGASALSDTGSGQSVPEGLRSSMEQTMGADFSDVRVHENSPNASKVGALAYAQGSDIHFAPGQYNPGSTEGSALIGHEMAHVVQQREGRVQPTTQTQGVPVNDDPALEQEADQMGMKAAQLMQKFKKD